ncbi:CBM21 domain-containing protein [Mycena kentingensis (nom. inval.)]|nr:CBM21 domain-containing protein [Mycena kentingensis (nom. inval.)]
MIATLAMTSVDSNAAGAPLPILPRRSASASRISFPTSTPTKPIKLVVQNASPDPDECPSTASSSSSFDGPVITLRPKRSRGVRPPEDSTPLPALARRPASPEDETPRPTVRPAVYSLGNKSSGSLRALSTSHLPVLSPPTPKTTYETPRILRKKSGEPLKSSLKSSTPKVRGSLEVVISGNGAGSSKSAPSTPTAGSRARVHFPSQLEQVKLFLAEQKPLAVSRDGSPTDDTSGTEDFPDFIFGRSREEDEGVVEMSVHVPPPEGEVDVKLQTLGLDEERTSVVGTVAVRNLSFDKWVAIRFTMDDWQTTSEVAARYSHSLSGGMVDVFSFNIRLTDVLARIDGKHMALAVRYNAADREMWDNNGGRNYSATFKRVRAVTPKSGDAAADLRSRLERVVNTEDPPIAIRADRNKSESIGFREGGSLAARYDFNASSKAPWRPHQRAQSHPHFASPSPPNGIAWPRTTLPQKPRASLGSPRDASEDGDFRPVPYTSSSEDSENQPFAVSRPGRNHQRGYFDMPLRDSAYGSVRRTPPGTPRAGTPLGSPGRYNSFPPLDPRGAASVGLGIGLDFAGRRQDASEDSTPSFSSASEGSSRSGSGSTSPISPPDFVAIEARLGSDLAQAADPETYHSFLDKFCFYTGSGSTSPIIPRTPSASSVQELLSVVSASPRLRALVTVNASLEDLTSSGASTPTTAKTFTPPSTSGSSVYPPSTPSSSVFTASRSSTPTPVAAA